MGETFTSLEELVRRIRELLKEERKIVVVTYYDPKNLLQRLSGKNECGPCFCCCEECTNPSIRFLSCVDYFRFPPSSVKYLMWLESDFRRVFNQVPQLVRLHRSCEESEQKMCACGKLLESLMRTSGRASDEAYKISYVCRDCGETY